jgi:predicted O-methyltransferase YrrM
MVKARDSLRRRYHSPLTELRNLSLQLHTSADEALIGLAALMGSDPPATTDFSLWRAEVTSVLSNTRDAHSSYFGPEYDLGPEGAALLYGLVRWRSPKHVIETGVARGVSTSVMLEALRREGEGRLTSFDIDNRAGSLVVGHPAHWEFNVLDPNHSLDGLRTYLRSAADISLFVHDSDHRAANQTAEYQIAYEILQPAGLIYSDDVDSSPAFLEFLRRYQLSGIALCDGEKFVGVAVMSTKAVPKGPLAHVSED